MKDALKRAAQALGFVAAPATAEVDNTDASLEATTVETLTVDIVTAGGAELAEKLASFETQFADQGALLTTALAQLAESQAALADVTAALKEVSDAKELAEADALATKLAARKAAVVAALGTDKADAFMAATDAMPDAQFDTVMAAMATSSVIEANSPAFNEAGVDASADVDALVAEAETSGTGALLAAKYQKQASK